MLIRYAYRFRLYPTTEQRVELACQLGCVLWMYNHFLARWQEDYAAPEKGLSYEDTNPGSGSAPAGGSDVPAEGAFADAATGVERPRQRRDVIPPHTLAGAGISRE